MNNREKNISLQEDEIEIDLADMFAELKYCWILLFMGLIVGTSIASVITVFCMKPVYRSTSMIYMRGNGSTIASLTDLQIGSELTNDYAVIFTSRTLLTQVIKELNLNMEYEELKSMIKISNPSDTRILELSVENQNASLACDIANKVVTLVAKTANEIDSKEPYLIDKAVIAEHPVSPSLYKNVLIGGSVWCDSCGRSFSYTLCTKRCIADITRC